LGRKKSLNLTDGELPLMQVLWKKGRATVGDVTASLPADPPLAYSTVLTTLRILEAKGYVSSFTGEPTAERGGRARTYFKPTAAGLREARDAHDTLLRLSSGLPELEGARPPTCIGPGH